MKSSNTSILLQKESFFCKSDLSEIILRGVPICRGIEIGSPFFIEPLQEEIPEFDIDKDLIESEIRRYKSAVKKGINDIRNMQKRLKKESIEEGAKILDGSIQMMQDALFTTHVEGKIRELKKNAEFVFKLVIDECRARFDTIEDPFFKERFKDIQDVSLRVMRYLNNGSFSKTESIPPNSVIFSFDITAFDTAQANKKEVLAFVTQLGGGTSHAAILAKAKGIPYITNIDIDKIDFSSLKCVIVDGRVGDLILNPTQETLNRYKDLKQQLNTHFQQLEMIGKYKSETYDGYHVKVSANIESVEEIERLHQFGANGVGLLRTESIFMSFDQFPIEDVQFNCYRNFVEKMQGLPLVIRTFDIGGDKYFKGDKNFAEKYSKKANETFSSENNPFLGCRAIRFLLREESIFRTQLRAILRASAFGPLSIMFPMISSLSELIKAKAILQEVKEELLKENIQVKDSIPIGCMVEVPSAAVITDLLVKECDFLSIGTNDLVQYALAVDRTNNSLRDLYSPTHPSVIRLIRLIVSEANHHGIPVTVCGEIAADPRFTPLLLGLGVHELSVATRYIPMIKNAIRRLSLISSGKFAEQVLLQSSANDIEKLLEKEYRENVPEDCFYNY